MGREEREQRCVLFFLSVELCRLGSWVGDEELREGMERHERVVAEDRYGLHYSCVWRTSYLTSVLIEREIDLRMCA